MRAAEVSPPLANSPRSRKRFSKNVSKRIGLNQILSDVDWPKLHTHLHSIFYYLAFKGLNIPAKSAFVKQNKLCINWMGHKGDKFYLMTFPKRNKRLILSLPVHCFVQSASRTTHPSAIFCEWIPLHGIGEIFQKKLINPLPPPTATMHGIPSGIFKVATTPCKRKP